jgi:hypothetical protein
MIYIFAVLIVALGIFMMVSIEKAATFGHRDSLGTIAISYVFKPFKPMKDENEVVAKEEDEALTPSSNSVEKPKVMGPEPNATVAVYRHITDGFPPALIYTNPKG